MKFNSKKILIGLALFFSNPKIRSVNQGTDQVPIKLNSPDLPDEVYKSKLYSKGKNAKTLEEFKRLISPDYKIECNKAAENTSFPDGNFLFIIGEEHNKRNVFEPFPGDKNAYVLDEMYDCEHGLHIAFKGLESIVCDGIDDKKTRDESMEIFIDYLKVSGELIVLIRPDLIPYLTKKQEDSNIPQLIDLCEKIIMENSKKLDNFKPEETKELRSRFFEKRKKFMETLDKVTEKEDNSSEILRDAEMAENIKEQVAHRNKYHPDAKMWASIGKDHIPGVGKRLKKTLSNEAFCILDPIYRKETQKKENLKQEKRKPKKMRM